MQRVLLTALLAFCAAPLCAQDALGPRLKHKSALASVAPAAAAPFRADAVFSSSAVNFEPALEREPVPGSCSVSAAALCYDYRNGRAVFKPARGLMPEIAGMRRENLSVKRDRITFSYSFH